MKKGSSLELFLMLAMMCLVAGCQDSYQTGAWSSITAGDNQENKRVYFMAGKIKAGEEADISSRITARVSNIKVNIGSVVKKGDTLIQLDTVDLMAQTAQADAGLSQARAAIEGAQSNYENAKSSHNRNQELFKAGAITQSQLEASKADLTAAESALNAARARLDQARAALQLASAELDNGLIVSPLDGVVTAININSGEIAAAGSQLLTVVNTDSLIVNAYMPSSLLNKINVGQQAVIKVAHIPDKVFKGQIYIIDSVMNSKNNKVLVKVRFADRDPLLKPGMFAEIGLNGVKESEGKTQ